MFIWMKRTYHLDIDETPFIIDPDNTNQSMSFSHSVDYYLIQLNRGILICNQKNYQNHRINNRATGNCQPFHSARIRWYSRISENATLTK